MKTCTLKLLLLILLFLIFVPSHFSYAATLVITPDIEQVSAIPYLSLLEDPEKNLSIRQVSSIGYNDKFRHIHTDYLNMGHNKSNWWLKLDVSRETLQSWYLFIDFVAITEADVYMITERSPSINFLGNMRKEQVFQRLPTLPLPEIKEKFTLYFHIFNSGREPLYLPIKLASATALKTKIAKDYLIFGGSILSLMVLVAYNIYLWTNLHNPIYLTLVFFLISLIMVLQRTTNVIPALSYLSNPSTFYYSFSFQLIAISSVQLWRQITQTRILFPQSDKAIRICLALMVMMIPFLNVMPYPDSWSYAMTAFLILAVGTLGLAALYKGSRNMRSFALSFFVFLGSTTPIILWGLGLLAERDVPLYILNVGALLSAILLSLTLAEHTRQLITQTALAQKASEAKDHFLTTMSHELRTPMHAVNGIISLFKFTPLSGKQQSYLNKLELSAEHMLDLINNILDLARINSSEFELEKHTFRLEELLLQTSQLLTHKAAQKQLLFAFKNHAQTDQLLVGDPVRLKQVLLNLLHNAIRFTEKGSVTLIVNEQITESGMQLQFLITDTGRGISQLQQQHIFQAFSQTDSGTQRDSGGSGLSLATSYHLIKRMGGELELISTPNKGSCFFFTLNFPTRSQAPAVSNATFAPQIRASHQPQPDLTVLLVDDVPLNLFVGSELLQTLGAEVITATSGQKALQALEQHPVDLVFMDISMPEMDGYETTLEIRQRPTLSNLPIIALTAHIADDELDRCLAAGMNDYLPKPFDLTQLQDKINLWANATGCAGKFSE